MAPSGLAARTLSFAPFFNISRMCFALLSCVGSHWSKSLESRSQCSFKGFNIFLVIDARHLEPMDAQKIGTESRNIGKLMQIGIIDACKPRAHFLLNRRPHFQVIDADSTLIISWYLFASFLIEPLRKSRIIWSRQSS